MSANLLQQPEFSSTTNEPLSGVDVEQYLNKRDRWLLEIVVWGIVIGVCILLAGSGFYFLIAEGFNPVNLLVASLGVAGTGALISKALNRYDFYQDSTPKITLSVDAICDHRTGVNVEFLDAQSYYFDQMFCKGNEIRASLHLGMKDGNGHFFDLRNLSVPSKEIASKVQSNSGLESVKPAVSSDPGQDRLLTMFAVVMVSVLILRVVFGLFGIKA